MKFKNYLIFLVSILFLQSVTIVSSKETDNAISMVSGKPEDVSWILRTAIELGESGRLYQARLYYWAFLFHHPQSSRAWNGLGHTCLFNDEMSEAIVFYKKGWKLGDVESLRYLGASYTKINDYDEVRSILPAMIDNVKTHPDFAVIIMTLSDYEEDDSIFIQIFDDINLDALARSKKNAQTVKDFLQNVGRDDLAKKVEKAMERSNYRSLNE